MKEPKEIWSGDYMSLFDDGRIGCSDGVGSVGGMDKTEVRELYEALKKYFEARHDI